MSFIFEEIPAKTFQLFVEDFEGPKTFFQSKNYGEFRTSVGEKIFYYGIFSEEKLIGVALIQKIKTKIKTYLHCPHGPLIEKNSWDFFLQEFKKLGKKEKADFVRISSLLPDENKSQELFKKNSYRPAPIHLANPERTWILDLTQSEEDILKNMKKSTRYEIKRIEKTDVHVQQGNGQKDLDIFWNLHLETVKRQRFTPFPKKNTEKELQVFKNNAQIFSASIEGKFYSSSIILFDKNSAYYHQGASLHSKAPVAHATLWESIKESKKRGLKEFNFWGVVKNTEKKHPWFGLSRFKRGFGGYEKTYLHCQDCPLTWKYWISAGLEIYRKIKKGY